MTRRLVRAGRLVWITRRAVIIELHKKEPNNFAWLGRELGDLYERLLHPLLVSHTLHDPHRYRTRFQLATHSPRAEKPPAY
jgi:hypothetical protein